MSETDLNRASTLGMKLIPQLGEIKKQSTDELADDLSALSVAIERLNTMVSRGESNRHDLLNAVAAVIRLLRNAVGFGRRISGTNTPCHQSHDR